MTRRRGGWGLPAVVLIAVLAFTGWAGERRWPPTPARVPDANVHAATAWADEELGRLLSRARSATVRYATDLRAAQRDGYTAVTAMVPDAGVRYFNPHIAGFDPEKPAILVYVGWGDLAQLGALEWVFTEPPAAPPLPGATYGTFAAACHYADGWLIASEQPTCEASHPTTAAPFAFWHPTLITLRVWLWYPNPAGIYHPANPLVRLHNASAGGGRWGPAGADYES
jgi:hypothetical protein